MITLLKRMAFPALLSIAGAAATASPITYQFTGAGSGTIGSTSFNETSFTITERTDTAAVTTAGGCNCLYADSASATIDITGVGTFDFVSGTRTFINHGVVGFSRAGGTGADLFDATFGAPVIGYQLASPLATVSGQGSLLQWSSDGAVITRGGTLFFDDGVSDATFAAFTTSVPEPANMALLLAGLGLIGVAARRRQR